MFERGGDYNERMKAWAPWIETFGIPARNVQKHPAAFTLEFAQQLGRCASDVERKLLLGIKEEA